MCAIAQIVRPLCTLTEDYVRRQARVSLAHQHHLQYEAVVSVVRVLDSAEELKATMCRGPKGLLLARFPSEEPSKTEIPQFDAGRERT